MRDTTPEAPQTPQRPSEAERSRASEEQAKKEFIEPKLERHETLPEVTGFTF